MQESDGQPRKLYPYTVPVRTDNLLANACQNERGFGVRPCADTCLKTGGLKFTLEPLGVVLDRAEQLAFGEKHVSRKSGYSSWSV